MRRAQKEKKNNIICAQVEMVLSASRSECCAEAPPFLMYIIISSFSSCVCVLESFAAAGAFSFSAEIKKEELLRWLVTHMASGEPRPPPYIYTCHFCLCMIFKSWKFD